MALLNKAFTFYPSCFSFCSLSHHTSPGARILGACLYSSDAYSNLQNFHLEKLSKSPNQPIDPKRLRVGVIGMPNAGKSTLINSLIGKHIMATSTRIDTTQDNVVGVLTEDNVQIEFQDSPGIHNKMKAKKVTGQFRNSFLPQQCLEKSDLAMVVVDLSEKRTSNGFLAPEILMHLMKCEQIPTILVLNKVDRLTEKSNVLPLISQLTGGVVDGVPVTSQANSLQMQPIKLPEIKSNVLHALDAVKVFDSPDDITLANRTESKILKHLRQCRGWPNFKEVFVISALKRRQTNELKAYLISKARSEPWKYHSHVESELSPYDAVKNEVRSAMLDNLAEEVPYVTEIHITNWVESDDEIEIFIDLVCPKLSHLRFLTRASSLISFSSKKRLKRIFPIDVELCINVYTQKEYAH